MLRTYCPGSAPAALPSGTVHGIRTAWLLIVMPRSRSMSIRSRYCARAARSSTTPVSCSIRSANVDLPWSMWAMMQKLRRIAGSVRPGCGAGVLDTEASADSRSGARGQDPAIVPSAAGRTPLGEKTRRSAAGGAAEHAAARQRPPQLVAALHGPADRVVVVVAPDEGAVADGQAHRGARAE